MCVCIDLFLLTIITVVVDKDDLLKQVGWCVIDRWVDRAQDHWQGLIDEDENEGDCGEVPWVDCPFTPMSHTCTHSIVYQIAIMDTMENLRHLRLTLQFWALQIKATLISM